MTLSCRSATLSRDELYKYAPKTKLKKNKLKEGDLSIADENIMPFVQLLHRVQEGN